MKRTNSYYHEFFARPAKMKIIFLNIFLELSYYFRIPIELITRRNLGERYFNIILSLFIGAGLIAFPIISSKRFSSMDWGFLFSHFGTWYLYTAFYFNAVFQRQKEIRTLPSVWEVKRFSKSEGSFHPKLKDLRFGDKQPNPKVMVTVVEPVLFFVPGAILALAQQPIGLLFMVCAVVYSLGYLGAYYKADNFMMDKIDDMITNEELGRVFLEDKEPERGFEFYGKRPADPDLSRKLYEEYIDVEIIEDDEPLVVN